MDEEHLLMVFKRDERVIGELRERQGAESRVQASLLRDVFGNPFRPATIVPVWLTPSVLAVAHSTYETRSFEELPILADALEETGCTDADLLSHLRGPGPHVRGCWVVDLVLGKK
jgi:hypothetical protein